jgi:hypothetical protein
MSETIIDELKLRCFLDSAINQELDLDYPNNFNAKLYEYVLNLQQQLANIQLANQWLKDNPRTDLVEMYETKINSLEYNNSVLREACGMAIPCLTTGKAELLAREVCLQALSTPPNTDALKQYVDAEIARRIGEPVAYIHHMYLHSAVATLGGEVAFFKPNDSCVPLYTLKD